MDDDTKIKKPLTQTITLRIDEETKHLLSFQGGSRLSISDVVKKALDEYIKAHNVKERHSQWHSRNTANSSDAPRTLSE